MSQQKLQKVVLKRPTGELYYLLAGITAALAALALLGAYMIDTRTYGGEIKPDAIFNRWCLIGAGMGLGNLALLCAITGSVIRALWFLTGEDAKESGSFDYAKAPPQ